MNCSKPLWLTGQGYVSCGQCMACRINRKRLWMHRMLLEMTSHSESSFVTLTYDDENLPDELTPKHLQDWLKRIRKDVEPMRLRFYGVGEYGEKSGRPHYHLALFGYPHCLRGNTDVKKLRCCTWCDRLRDTWGKGVVYSGPLTSDSAQYICGYVTKKMTARDDPRLEGKHPEFSRQSRNPGIGANFVGNIADVLRHYNLDYTQDDVPVALRHGKKVLPLGRFLRGKIRENLGWDKNATEKAKEAYSLKMLDLQKDSINTNRSAKEILQNRSANKIGSMIYKDKLKKRKD